MVFWQQGPAVLKATAPVPLWISPRGCDPPQGQSQRITKPVPLLCISGTKAWAAYNTVMSVGGLRKSKAARYAYSSRLKTTHWARVFPFPEQSTQELHPQIFYSISILLGMILLCATTSPSHDHSLIFQFGSSHNFWNRVDDTWFFLPKKKTMENST